MCGIAGSVNKTLNIEQLTRDLFHRGPDEQTTFREDRLTLHHHRLAILDIAGGHQPMHYHDLVIIFNGEIYNHQSLRKKYGLVCQTNSDTETLLHLYEKLGPAFLDDLDGMFAIVIYDRKNQQLFITRDRAGKKPVYYYNDKDAFVFASELNALRNQVPVAINQAHLQQFIRTGYFYKSSTPYEKVYELPAGSYAYVSLNDLKVSITKWWNVHDHYLEKQNESFDAALEKVDSLLHTAIKNRVESSDLEVGSFLSGGIDSGLVTAIAKGYNSTLKTFTVSFDGAYDEAPLAKLVADRYNTYHHEIKISFDHLQHDVEKILANYGEPFMDSSAIPSYYVSLEARKYLTVILNGDGGDEIFGGYRRYVPFAKHDFFKSNAILKALAAAGHAVLPVPHEKKNKYSHIYRLLDLARKNGFASYLSATIDSFEGFDKYLVTDKGILDEMQRDFSMINSSDLTGLQKIMNLDFDNILAGDLLVKMDIATMSHSLEGRSPLLCKELLDYVPGLPDSYKISGGKTKYLLRKLATKYLPPELIDQPKRGFEIPLKKWIDNELKEIIGDHILAPGAFCRNFVAKNFPEILWNRKLNTGDEKRAKMIWTLFSLEVWYKKCYLQHA
jgi:asparagine synthase (glutamine-hydrolysing)